MLIPWIHGPVYNKKKSQGIIGVSPMDVSIDKIIQSYYFYMKNEPKGIPDSKTYIANIEFKLKDPEFLSDTALILHPSEEYDPAKAYDILKDLLFLKL